MQAHPRVARSRPRLLLCGIISLAPLFIAVPTPAQSCTPTWNSPIASPGANGVIRALIGRTEANENVLYAGGFFTTINSVSASKIARFDGANWTPLGAGMNNTVLDLALFDDGAGEQLYAAGSFTAAGAVIAQRLARWDGAAWSSIGAFNGSVFALAVFNDGSGDHLYAAGAFTTIDSLPAKHIARYDGANWAPLNAGVGPTAGAVFDLAVFNGRLIAAGDFNSADASPASNIAAWDGATWSALGPGLNDEVHTLLAADLGAGQRLFAGGVFTLAGSTSVNRIAQWDGASWTPLGAGVTDTGARVRALALYNDNGPSLFVGGEFLHVGNNVTASRIARYDGANWFPVDQGVDTSVAALAPFGDPASPQLAVAGDFTAAGPNNAENIAAYTGCPITTPIRAADINADGEVNSGDMALLLGAWDTAFPEADLNNDGQVNSGDLALLLGDWG